MDQRLPDPAGAAPPDWRGLCQELLDEVLARPLIPDRALIDRARAALAQPEPEVVGPTRRELLDLARAEIDGLNQLCLPDGSAADITDGLEAFARAVLARFGRRPAPAPATRRFINNPVQIAECGGPCADGGPEACDCGALWCDAPAPAPAGEVAELVAWLRVAAGDEGSFSYIRLNRAADLLERQAAPVPVAVSERLPGAEDCDAEGRVWLYRPQTPILNPYWDLVKLDYIDIDPVSPTHWLPARALPLPTSEAQP